MTKFNIGDKVITTKQGGWYEPGEVFTLVECYIGEWHTGWFVEEKDDSHFIHEENIELYPKSLLTNGRRVKLRNGKMLAVLDGSLIVFKNDGDLDFHFQGSYQANLKHNRYTAFDILSVYEKHHDVCFYFNYEYKTDLLWQCEEKTAKQLQLEALQKQAQDVADAIKKLQDEE